MSVPSLLARRGRRRSFLVLVVVVSALVATACEPPPPPNPPFWHPGTTVTATVHGPLVRLAWDAPTGGNAAASYQVSLSTTTGTVVGFMPSSMRACYLRGLAASTTYTILVTARDASGEWSGPLSGTKGNRKTTVTTASNARAGSDPWCLSTTDSDGDGLPDTFETDDGTYLHAADAGTDPNVADTDGDGITDGTETLGRPGLDLIAMGARPTHKDLLLEYDWITTPSCATGFRPTASTVSALVAAYAAAPLTNPDGVGGIKLIVDHGQGGPFTGGNAITHDGSHVQGVWDPVFQGFKAAHFGSVRHGIFHYAVRLNGTSNAVSLSDSFTIGDPCNNDPHDIAAMTMHEMGHNLGLSHGGATTVNHIPNYNSIMNYTYDLGIDTDCDWWGDGVLDYSQGLNAPLDESDLDETVGICDGRPIDWDGDGVIESSVQADINQDGRINLTRNGATVFLTDHDDWAVVEARGLRESIG